MARQSALFQGQPRVAVLAERQDVLGLGRKERPAEQEISDLPAAHPWDAVKREPQPPDVARQGPRAEPELKLLPQAAQESAPCPATAQRRVSTRPE